MPAMDHRCDVCNRSFRKAKQLKSHQQLAHAAATPVLSVPVPEAWATLCMLCRRDLKTEKALLHHLTYAPEHRYQQWTVVEVPIDFPVESPVFGLIETDKPKMDKPKTRKTKTRKAAAVPAPLNSPLDRFFHSYQSFRYDPHQSPSASFAALQAHYGWGRETPAQKMAWARYSRALASELEIYFGTESDIQNWHTLLRAVGVRDLPPDMDACEKIMRRLFVNIVDLVNWARHEGDQPVRTFESLKKLRTYTKDSGKIFAQDDVRDSTGNPDVVIRHLLRKIA